MNDQTGKLYPCDCAIERKIAKLLPEKYRNARLADFNGDVLRVVTNWLARPTAGLFITGASGTGKTFLAAAMTDYLMKKRIVVEFHRCTKFLLNICETYRVNGSVEAVLQPLERAPILVLDDLGAGSLSDHERRFTLELIERRLIEERPTIVTTNMTLARISESMDDRIASRLSAFTIIELCGPDLRIRRVG